ncbi:hypothetical protein FH972_024876 [Carpinus fangiana]|uniref:2-dehydropantoate 2-reductase n=1 Tax=Carpinus fangiana TaxID=176857 RepID=A0A5N6KZD7_9ROSI|nr:hypothetical protein FH972_024876 [Carpinus fangiana]
MATTNVLIVGAGAIGAFYASRLAVVENVEVSVVCRSNYKAVKASGFHVLSPQYGDSTFRPTHTFGSPQEAAKSGIKWDYAVVTTKALPDVSDDSKILEGLVSRDTAIVLIQNGLGVEDPYTKSFPDASVITAVTIASAAQTEPGVIKHNRWTRIEMGPYLPKGSSREAEARATKQTQTFESLLRQGGVKDAHAYDHADLQLKRWHKIAINASMNPSSVLTGGASNNAMSLDPEMSQLLHGVMTEVLETAPKILGRQFPAKGYATPEAIIKSTQKNTSGSVPSMQLDWESGKHMELEVILGNPIRLAREHGLSMPRMETLYALVKMAQTTREEKKQSKI